MKLFSNYFYVLSLTFWDCSCCWTPHHPPCHGLSWTQMDTLNSSQDILLTCLLSPIPLCLGLSWTPLTPVKTSCLHTSRGPVHAEHRLFSSNDLLKIDHYILSILHRFYFQWIVNKSQTTLGYSCSFSTNRNLQGIFYGPYLVVLVSIWSPFLQILYCFKWPCLLVL